MPEDVKIPGLGNVDKKYVIAGVVIGGGVAVIVYIRSKKAAQNAATSSTTFPGLVTDPAGNQCAALGASGYCPGTPEDLAYSQQYADGSGAYGGYTGSDYGYPGGGAYTSSAGLVTDAAGNQCSIVNPLTGYCPGTPQDISAQAQLNQSGTATTGTGTTATGSTAPTTNSEWMTDALAVLPGGASSSNQSALASVLGGLTVTTAQKNVFMEAVGLIGQPPQGYPTIKTSDTAAQGSNSMGNSTSKTAGPIGVVSLSPSGTGVQAKWSTAQNATGGYAWKLTGPKNESGTTTGTVVTIHNLPKGAYSFGVQGLPGGVGNNAHTTIA